jgi:hypothetical protein
MGCVVAALVVGAGSWGCPARGRVERVTLAGCIVAV